MVAILAELMPVQTEDMVWLGVGTREVLTGVAFIAVTLVEMWLSKILMYNKTISLSLMFILASNPRNI